jgi:malate synthase
MYIQLKDIRVALPLYDFVNDRLLPVLDMNPQEYWEKFETILLKHVDTNQALLTRRDELQGLIDQWHRQNDYNENELSAYKQFLSDIGYLAQQVEDFTINVDNVDREISSVAAPQLVVPINNARFAINAANARWGSLYDSLYGTDMIDKSGETAITGSYNALRGLRVFDFCNQWLDQVLPLQQGSHADAVAYRLDNDGAKACVQAQLNDGSITALQQPEQFRGYQQEDVLVLLFVHHDLHFELHIDVTDKIGAQHPAGLKDIVIEAAVTTIQDCEDSVAAVDIEDKVLVYANWLGLINSDLSVPMEKNGKTFERRLNDDRHYLGPDGQPFSLPGRSLMLIRNTGLHMKSELVLNNSGDYLPEGLIDALITVLISMNDLRGNGRYRNSGQGSIYIVKPKCHGPEEVAFCCDVFSDIEQAYGLSANTVKIGVMDEERRTTVNLKACVRAAKERVIFINTGFLDRTGDEIHTSMLAGAVLPKTEIKQARWIQAYEDWNVDVGLGCGMGGRAQIGKGMWAVPDEMRAMYDTKQAHPEAGASCAWVPSPTAAVIHALHYHQVDVKAVQQKLTGRPFADIDAILAIPLLPVERTLSDREIQQELDNNAQGILGYVVKWIDLGIGCSKVPDIHDVGLMEDRATLRISSQHMANWLQHGLCSEQQVRDTFERMAAIVDQQNATTPEYINMAPEFNGFAFQAALDLVLKGAESPNGYTEELLQQYRQKAKAALVA